MRQTYLLTLAVTLLYVSGKVQKSITLSNIKLYNSSTILKPLKSYRMLQTFGLLSKTCSVLKLSFQILVSRSSSSFQWFQFSHPSMAKCRTYKLVLDFVVDSLLEASMSLVCLQKTFAIHCPFNIFNGWLVPL